MTGLSYVYRKIKLITNTVMTSLIIVNQETPEERSRILAHDYYVNPLIKRAHLWFGITPYYAKFCVSLI